MRRFRCADVEGSCEETSQRQVSVQAASSIFSLSHRFLDILSFWLPTIPWNSILSDIFSPLNAPRSADS